MRTVRILAVLAALLLPFMSTPTASADEPGERGLVVKPWPPEAAFAVGAQLRPNAINNQVGDTWESPQWFADGEPIPGATDTRFTPGPEHLGKMIMVEATAVRPGAESFRVQSAPVGPIVKGVPVATAHVRHAGDGVLVGTLATIEFEVHNEGVELEFHGWLLDGLAIPGATERTLMVTRAMGGKLLGASVTLSGPGYETVSTTLAAAVVRGAVTPGGVNIEFADGWAYAISDGQWRPHVDRTSSFEWFVDDRRVGEDDLSLELLPQWSGKLLKVRMTSRYPNLEPASTMSAAVRVPKLAVEPEPQRPLDVYTTPGRHSHNGREWLTECERYSQTTRCRTDIIASTVLKQADGSYRLVNDWAFNNLTYLPSSAKLWHGNPLAHPGEWTAADGRRWKTECFATTLPHVCRSYAWTHYMVPVAQNGPVPYRYVAAQGWVFNNQVHVR